MPRAIDDSAFGVVPDDDSSSVIRSASNARFVSIAPITAPAIEARWRQARRVRSSNADGRFAYAVSVPYRTPPAVSATPIADRNPLEEPPSHDCPRSSARADRSRGRRGRPARAPAAASVGAPTSVQGNGRRLEELRRRGRPTSTGRLVCDRRPRDRPTRALFRRPTRAGPGIRSLHRAVARPPRACRPPVSTAPRPTPVPSARRRLRGGLARAGTPEAVGTLE